MTVKQTLLSLRHYNFIFIWKKTSPPHRCVLMQTFILVYDVSMACHSVGYVFYFKTWCMVICVLLMNHIIMKSRVNKKNKWITVDPQRYVCNDGDNNNNHCAVASANDYEHDALYNVLQRSIAVNIACVIAVCLEFKQIFRHRLKL